MKKLIVGGVALLLATAMVILGPGNLLTQLRAWRNQTAQTWENGLSDDQIRAQIQVKLKDLESQIRTYHVKVGEAADRTASAQVRFQELTQKLESETKLLVRVKAMMDKDQPHYVVAGRTYSRKEIDEEGRLRLVRCQQLEKQAESQRKLADDLHKILDQGKANLTEAQRLKDEMNQELQVLESRLANARLHKEVLDLTALIKGSPISPDSELSQQMEQLRKRARTTEQDIEYLTGQVQNNPIVNWNNGSTSEDVGQAIARYLKSEESPVSQK